jgi:uncharacterized membrane protein YvbJ
MGDDAKFCPACGKPAQQQQTPLNQSTSINTYFENAPTAKPGDEGSAFWWGVLCFVVPVIGIILYFNWREKYPKRAKVCLWCGVISLIFNVISYFAMPEAFENLNFLLLRIFHGAR